MSANTRASDRNVFEQGRFLQINGQFDEAAKLYQKHLRRQPANLDLLYQLAVVRLHQGKIPEALQHFNALIKHTQRSAHLYLMRGNCFFLQNRFSDAERDYRACLEIDGRNVDAYQNLALINFETGKINEAIEFIDVAIRIRPDYAQLYFNKGNLLDALHKSQDALSCYNDAIKFDDKYAEAHLNRGNILKKINVLDEAIQSYTKAIKSNENYPQAYNNRGLAYMDIDRYDRALVDFNRALTINPAYAEAYYNQGQAFLALNRAQDALGSFDKAISFRAEYVDAYIGKADALSALNDIATAFLTCTNAVKLDPNSTKALLCLGNLYFEQGNFAEAEGHFQKALSIDPNSIEPILRLAVLKKYEDGDPIVQNISDRLDDQFLSDKNRSQLHHAYGKILNDFKSYDAAFMHFLESKKYQTSNFDLMVTQNYYTELRSIFTSSYFLEQRNTGLPDTRPVFVVGMPRSGTSLVEQVLASHPLVIGLGELNDLPNIITQWRLSLKQNSSLSDAVKGLTADTINHLASQYMKAYKSVDAIKTKIVDKRPHNFELLGFIALMFPNSRIIHCQRDPLDTCVSIFMQNFNESHSYNQSLKALGEYYREYEILMAHWYKTLPIEIYSCRYEELINDFENSVRRILRYINLEWNESCLNFHKNERKVNTPSMWQVRQPLYSSSVGIHKRYEKFLGELKSGLNL